MTSKKVPFWVIGCIIIAAGLSLSSLSKRYKIEQDNKAVALCVELETVQALSAAEGLTLDQGLEELKQHGVNAVVLPEEYASELASQGKIQFKDGQFVSGSPDAMSRFIRGLGIRYPALAQQAKVVGAGQEATAIQLPDLNLVRSVAIGIDPAAAQTVSRAGMMIVARCGNPNSGSGESVRRTIQWSHELGATVFMPEGDQVLGQKDSLDALVDELNVLHMFYASPEFAKIAGDDKVVSLGSDPEKHISIVLRLHSAQSQELDKMPPEEAVDRFARAARERNQRLLLLRPLSPASAKPLTDFGVYVAAVKDELIKQGGTVGIPKAFDDPALPNWLFVLIGLAVAPVAAWTFACFVPKRVFQVLFALLALALAAACYKHAGRPIMAILAAITFPTAAFLILDFRRARFWILEYVLMSLVSLVGGLCVAGMLNGLPYYVRAEQFEGVKFAHFFPILVVGAYFFWRFVNAKEALDSPMRWGKALLSLVVLAGLTLMFMRTGNDNPAAVSGTELKIRDLLDILLMVRPRTKEFLIGHPFLILGIGMLISIRQSKPQFQDWKGWMALLLMLGAIGQTSIVNTLCHLHTPLAIGIARIGVGLAAGGIIGAVLLLIVKRIHRGAEV